MKKLIRTLAGAFGLFWRGVDQARRFTVNLLFLFLVALAISWLLVEREVDIPDSTALVVAPYGDLVEQLSGDSSEQALFALMGERPPETLMRDLLEALAPAKDDDRVKVLLLDLDRLGRAGLSKLQTLGAAIEEFKESGKPVIARGDFYGQGQYYLASKADEIYLHPMGIVLSAGYGSYRNYFKEALDRLAVDWHVFRVGEYKSAVEPYLRDDMSPEAREARQRWLSVLWQAYTQDVESARQLAPGTLQEYASEFADRLADHRGDAAELARSIGLVTHIAHRDEVRDRLIELVGEDEEGGSFRQIDFRSYLRVMKAPPKKSENAVAVVVARGAIYDGNRVPGSIGGDSTARLIRQAREDEQVKALVLRVDSPGGSAFASEIIRREIERVREAGKPVIASMSSVAASGGYWISMSADEIWAAPTSITGSIGIYAMLPTFPRTLDQLGVHNDGVGTGELAGTLRPDRTLPEPAARAMDLLIQQGYREFIEGVAEGRGKDPDEVDAVARGRVWVGVDAHALGLVDHLGGLDEAIATAATRAELGDDYRVAYLEPERDWRDRVLGWLVRALAVKIGPLPSLEAALGPDLIALEELVDDAAALTRYGDPNGIYAYCFCEPN